MQFFENSDMGLLRYTYTIENSLSQTVFSFSVAERDRGTAIRGLHKHRTHNVKKQ